MNTFTQTMTIDWINSIGWTLVHSLWQALLVFLLVAAVLRLLPTLQSSVRYAIASAGLLLTGAVSVVTFINIAGQSAAPEMAATGPFIYQAVYIPQAATDHTALFPFITSLIEQYMSWLVLLWAVGFFVFALRWAFGLYHSYRIRSGAQLVAGEWFDYVQRTATALAIARPVRLAESALISAPMVLGYLKPVILIPVGMIAGLTTQQLETIFVHELAHIRRNDYMMNFLQTIIESIFFFNPFVRMLSNDVRREREYCCDDIVVRVHGNNAAYAHALVRLAEARLTVPAFALALTGDKNQLLARIKRIMERSSKNASFRSRMLLPLLLTVGALASVSWISADRDEEKNKALVLEADTAPDQQRNSARFSRRSIIAIDENGQPYEEIIQEFEGNEELRALLEQNMAIFDTSAFSKDFNGFAPGQFPDGSMMQLWSDTIPPFGPEGWEGFADAFNDQFHERFENFFEGHGDPGRFMEEFQKDFNWEEWATPFDHLPLDSLGKLRDGDVFKNFKEEIEKFREFTPEGMEDFKRSFTSFDNPVQDYERALRDQLIEDAYLSQEETIESLQWSDDSFKVNGKSLKPEDVKRYNDLRKGILEDNRSKKVQ